ncbi:TetR family transcriptional regulator [Herbihabitans rhizosphaerae]|uniref:TetR family transcriptional regulator n=1 Tax=Herbihabitans rhizosphaerae TaxID=1872711 RepID=A0A4Q7L789_9PSEU|nr:TetR family transcriptional regulator [Herbihabitans rhizosphaerae]RZS44750.1 TetR family transcriptional regulator [Herbihabitans rhizosphaerae]
MTVNKPGRPSKAVERRAEILDAMARVVARSGLDDATVSAVADEAGMQRTLVFHYFGDRPGLLAAFIDEVVGGYGRRMLGAEHLSIEARIDRAFAPGFYANRDDLVVWTELVALAARDDTVRDRLRVLWLDVWLPEVERQLALAAPTATTAAVGQVAYGLTCLVEAHWAFVLQGVDAPKRRRQARAAARLLLAGLPVETIRTG